MKRILQITSTLERNGTETFIMNVLRHIKDEKVIFDFLVYKRTDKGYEQEARDLGANIYTFTSRSKGFRKHIRSLHTFFKEHGHKYDAVHFNGNSFTGLLPMRIAKKYGIPVRIVHCHNSATYGFHNKILHRLNKSILHTHATHFIACSDSAREWGYGKTKVYDRSIVLPNGINLMKFAFNPESRKGLREELGIGEHTLVVSNTAGFRPVKNHAFLIEIFHRIHQLHPDSILLLCGAGETEHATKRLAEEKGLKDAVRFLGLRTDIERILSATDVYIFPSLYEGLPFTLIEAQASGLPVLASDTISPQIKLTDTLEFMSLDKSATEWAEKALEMNKLERNTVFSEALKKYSIDNTCRELLKIYHAID